MDAAFDITIHPTYLHINHPPGFVIDPAALDKLWAIISQLSREHDRKKVLIEATSPTRQLDTMGAFDSGRVLAENMAGLTIAVCLRDYRFDDLTTFFKTVAQNRGVRIEFFSELDEALKWLDVDTGENAARGL
jgi:hypothetical protein